MSHGDEDDAEALQRIHEQSRRDADWLVTKYAAQAAEERERAARRKRK